MRSYKIVEFGQTLQEFLEDTPVPQGTEVLVRVTGCGVCHSDIHLWQGYFDLCDVKKVDVSKRGLDLPFTLGHESVGEVAALGPEAEGVALGDKRIVFPWIGCGACATCASGRENICDQPRFIGTRRAGGYADHVLVPHARYLLDYSGIDEKLAALYACSGVTAYSAIKKITPLAPEDSVLMIGAGGVGLMGIRLGTAMTEAKIIVADIDESKRDLARQNGADDLVDPAADGAVERIIESTGGGVLAAIDFVGAPSSAQFGFDCMRRGGKLIIVGLYGGALSVSLPLLPFRMATIAGSYVGTLGEMAELLDLVRSGAVAPVPVTTRPLSQASEALADLVAGRVMGRTVLSP